MKVKTPRFILLLLIVFSCKQEKGEVTVDTLPKVQKTDTLIHQKPAYPGSKNYEKGKVDEFDWNLVFNKTKEYRGVSKEYSDKKIIPKDFLEFSMRFISDSTFQKEHIDFDKLIAVTGSCEETYILKENNWVFDDWDFVNNLGIDEEMENTFYFSDQVFYCNYLLKEIGTIRTLGFEKKDGEWCLTLYNINDC